MRLPTTMNIGFILPTTPSAIMSSRAWPDGLRRGETASFEQMAERVKLDLWYINNWSLGLDINILVRTCFEVLGDRAF